MTTPKTGRNDPCPCGSGKKHKQCCLGKDEVLSRIVNEKSVPLRLAKVPKINGFAARNTLAGEQAEVLVRARLTSDEPMFYTYLEGITGLLLAPARVIADRISTFLLVIHADDSADLYLNDNLVTTMEVRPKRDLKAGELVNRADIADIRRVKFAGVTFASTDRVIYCAKVGWKFGLFFSLHHEGHLEVDAMELELGTLHRRLGFEYVYNTLDSAAEFAALRADGWFPFVEIVSDGYPALAKAYKDRFDFDAKIIRVVEMLSDDRLDRMQTRWWTKPTFVGKQKILAAGVDAYKQRTEAGYITCIKTLATEVEGILRAQYTADTGAPADLKMPALTQHIIDKETKRSGSDASLLLPTPFLAYLKDVIFRGFDVTTGDVTLSRHSTGHGVAKQEDYTRARALQLILTLDQIWFFS